MLNSIDNILLRSQLNIISKLYYRLHVRKNIFKLMKKLVGQNVTYDTLYELFIALSHLDTDKDNKIKISDSCTIDITETRIKDNIYYYIDILLGNSDKPTTLSLELDNDNGDKQIKLTSYTDKGRIKHNYYGSILYKGESKSDIEYNDILSTLISLIMIEYINEKEKEYGYKFNDRKVLKVK